LQDYDHDINYVGPNIFDFKDIFDRFVTLTVYEDGVAGIDDEEHFYQIDFVTCGIAVA